MVLVYILIAQKAVLLLEGRWGSRQIFTALMDWAIPVKQGRVQKEASVRTRANPQSSSQYKLSFGTQGYSRWNG
jgi:hypothetical protein